MRLNLQSMLRPVLFAKIAPWYRKFFWNYEAAACLILDFGHKGNYLEAGGGNGQFAATLLYKGQGTVDHITVIDIAKDVGGLIPTGFNDKVTLFPNIKIQEFVPTEKYDVITVIDVLHHVTAPEVKQILCALVDMTDSDGAIFIKEHGANKIMTYLAWIADTFISRDKPKKFWSPEELKNEIYSGVHNHTSLTIKNYRLDKGNFLLYIQKPTRN